MEEESMLRDEPLKYKEANEKIRKLVAYKLPEGIVRPPGQSLADFVKIFIMDWSIKHPTLYSTTGVVQTGAGKRRSLGDITRLAQTYYPGTSLEEVKNILKSLLNSKTISTGICKTIYKRVFFYRTNRVQSIEELDERDEFGWIFNLEEPTKVPKKKL